MTQGRYPGVPKPPGQTRPLGRRLSDPHDPAVRDALRRRCPACKADVGVWCVGVDEREGSRTRGRTLTRIHIARCTHKAGT